MQKVKDLDTLKKFSTLYKDYKILDFDNSNKNLEQFKKNFENNQKIILSSLMHLDKIINEFDETTPTTQVTFQVITENFVTEKRYVEVQLNLKRWQQIAKTTDASPRLQKMLMILTGFRDP